MSWSAIERCARGLWTTLLLFLLMAAATDLLAASGLIDDGLPDHLALWELHGYPSLRNYYESTGTLVLNILYAIVGLWIPQRRLWLNWAWSIPLVGNAVLAGYLGN